MQAARHAMPPLEDLKPFSDFIEPLGVSRSTLWRWYKYGVNTPSGRVHLFAWDVGEWRTTDDEVRSFIERRTAGKLNAVEPAPTTSAANKRRAKAVRKDLAKQGVKVKAK